MQQREDHGPEELPLVTRLRAGLFAKLLCLGVLASGSLTIPALAAWDTPYAFPEIRDPLEWPFAADSIWNQPIGSNAVYPSAGIPPSSSWALGADEEIIILTPTAPQVQVWEHNAGWTTGNRCGSLTGNIFPFTLPIPDNFSTDPGWIGTTPNMCSAVLMPDSRTLKQSQPFHRCGVGGIAVTEYLSPDVDIYGDGIKGSHGGSGLSGFGGCLRVGELVPGAPPIHHALKVELHLNQPNACTYRWPALWCDGPPLNGGQYMEGALLALPPYLNISGMGFETEPGKYLARAFQDYGAYVVDNSGWDVWNICVEWGPAGRVIDEFKQAWGFDMQGPNTSTNSPWGRDMMRIFLNLSVVENNGPNSIGGGGGPRAPLAPPFQSPPATNAVLPVLVSASGHPNQATLQFSEEVDAASAAVTGHFSLSDGVPVLAAARNSFDWTQVILTTGWQQLGKLYTVTANGVLDLLGNAATNTMAVFRSTISIDGNFDDWQSLAPLCSQQRSTNPGACNWKALYAWNDADYFYFRIDTWDAATLCTNYFQMFFDTDKNAGTGYSYWHGTELLVLGDGQGVQERSGGYNEGLVQGLDWLCLPSGTGTNFEFRISRHCEFTNGTPVFTTNRIKFVLASFNSNWAVLDTMPWHDYAADPNTGGMVAYALFSPEQMAVSCANNLITITWDNPAATLESADSLAGPWSDLSNSSYPVYIIPATNTQEYFRLIQ